MKMAQPQSEKLPAFDPKAACIKCGWSIPDPPPPEPKFGPKDPTSGKQEQLPAPPPAPPTPPTVQYCNGMECPWDEGEPEPVNTTEHLHQWCDTCGFEWLAEPVQAG